MASLPTRGTSRRLTASSATRRTVQRPLLLAIVEQRGRAGAWLIEKGPLQSALLKAVAYLPDCLRGQRDKASDLRGADALRHLQQGKCPQDGSDGLDTAAKMGLQVLAVVSGEPDLQGRSGHIQVCSETFPHSNVL